MESSKIKDISNSCRVLVSDQLNDISIDINQVKENIVKLRSDKNYRIMYYIAALIILGVIIVLLYKIYRLVNKDILIPIDEMHKSASEILKENYLEKVSYDYHGEIGEFFHDFESMRDGLVASREKEKKLKTAEKELLPCISHDLKTPEFFTELLEEASMDVISSGRQFILEGEIPNLLITMDKDKIAQAINNIISNAVKYTSIEGVIKISFERIYEGLKISIKDNGVGIAADELSSVFNKFYRGEKHRNQNIPGSGLGLSIAKYIAEAHRGSIEMISSKDKGTEVIMKIRN